jgi:transposase
MKTKEIEIKLTEEEKREILEVSKSKTEQYRKVSRAKMIIRYIEGRSISKISRELSVAYNTVVNTLEKLMAMGVEAALTDLPRSGRPGVITDEDKIYVVGFGCQKPVSLGYPEELWTYELLTKHIREKSIEDGHPILQKVAKSKVWSILNDDEIKPHKIKYFQVKTDPEFEKKRRYYRGLQRSNDKKSADRRNQLFQSPAAAG